MDTSKVTTFSFPCITIHQTYIVHQLADIITPQAISLGILITSLHKLHPRKTFDMVDTRSKMKLADLNSKPYGGKSLINIIDRAIGAHFYSPPGSVHYKLLCLDQFYGTSHINCEKKKKSEIKMTKISDVRNRTTKPRSAQI